VHTESVVLIDLGNTRLKAKHSNAPAGSVFSVAHAQSNWAEEFQNYLRSNKNIHSAIVASVADHAITSQMQAVLTNNNISIEWVRSQAAFQAIRCAYKDPDSFGVDRFLGLIAAHQRFKQACLIVSIGSVLCIDLIDADGQHIGGLLASTASQQQKMLATDFPALQSQGGSEQNWASTTADAIISGTLFSNIALIEHSMQRAEQQLGHAVQLVITGGGAMAVLQHFSAANYVEYLVLEGLQHWAKHTQDKTR